MLYEFDDMEADLLTSCAMICVDKPSAKVSYWDKGGEPPIFSASLAVFDAPDLKSYFKALSYFEIESKKKNKLVYFVINNNSSDKVDPIIIKNIKKNVKTNADSDYFVVNL